MIKNMEKRNKNIEFFLYVLFLIDILVIQRFSRYSMVGLQDVTATISVFVLIYYLLRFKEIKLNSTYRYMLMYILYLLLTNLVLLFINKTEPIFVFYILKNIVYFLCFLITFLSYKNNSVKSKQIVIIIIILNTLYGLYLLFSNQISYYGIGTLFEIAPSRSGNIYFISALISFFFYKEDRIKSFLILFILNSILTLATISKTNILGLIIFLFMYYFIELFKKIITNKKFKMRNIVILFVVIIIFVIVIILLNNISINMESNNIFIAKIKKRFAVFDNSYNYRFNKGKRYLNYFFKDKSIFSVLFGTGKGITEIKLNKKTASVDNQYVRALIEIGLIGIILWLSIIYNIYKKVITNRKIFFLSFFISYLGMSIGYEIFVVTKSGIIFFFMLAIILGYRNPIKKI